MVKTQAVVIPRRWIDIRLEDKLENLSNAITSLETFLTEKALRNLGAKGNYEQGQEVSNKLLKIGEQMEKQFPNYLTLSTIVGIELDARDIGGKP